MRAVAVHLIFRVVHQTDLLKVYFTKFVVGTKFPKQAVAEVVPSSRSVQARFS